MVRSTICLFCIALLAVSCSKGPESTSTPAPQTGETKTEQATEPAGVKTLTIGELDSVVKGHYSQTDVQLVATWPWTIDNRPPFEDLAAKGVDVSVGKMRNPGLLIAVLRNPSSAPLGADLEAKCKDFIQKTNGHELKGGISLTLGPDGKTPVWMGSKNEVPGRNPKTPPGVHKIEFPTLDKAKSAENYFSRTDYEMRIEPAPGSNRKILVLTMSHPTVDPEEDALGLSTFAAQVGGKLVD